MTKEELAMLLNGREYTEEITKDEEQQAKESGLVVVYGASDDIVEFRGAICDEAGAYGDSQINITREGLPENECDDSDCPYFINLLQNMPKIYVFWDKDGYSWKYEVSWPVAEFDIVEGEDKY